MAKDGTVRGGARPGAGRKPKPLAEKINAGKSAKVIDLPEPASFDGNDMPPVKEYLKREQKVGEGLLAQEIYAETYAWLKERGCERLVNSQLIESYAMSVSRWIQCENAISEYGFLAKHPTTGAACASPYVAMSQAYMKQINQVWYQIFQVVKENCASDFDGSPNDDLMEKLLRSRQ